MRRRWPWIVVIVTLCLALAAAIAGPLVADDLVQRRLRPAMIELLRERFNADVEVPTLEVDVWPALSVRAERMVLRHRTRRDIPPLITIETLTIEGSVREVWNRRIDRVRLHGLQIVIPPRRGEDIPKRESTSDSKPDVFIRELVTDHSALTITSKRPGKPPRVFDLSHLKFENLHFSTASAYDATLTNPVPRGEIHAVGTFGPWNGDEPSLTPLDGSFRFDADLGTIDGIGGALHAEGSFNGPLERIETRGRTTTPNFRLSTGGSEFPLTTEYRAIVDGTSGDTVLESVEADLASSHISARGEVVRVEGVKGRRVSLQTSAKGGRIEDFIRLTTRVKNSPLVGAVDVTAKLEIPPGQGEVLDRMDLDGTFNLASARFTSQAVQNRIDELSRRGQGRPEDETIDDVASNMRGSFKLAKARMTLRSLRFSVRGAEVRLAGNYGVKTERLDFAGTLRLQASASATQTGWKSVVLKVFDPLFKREGAGTVLPITVTGTKDQPKFGVDLKKALLRR